MIFTNAKESRVTNDPSRHSKNPSFGTHPLIGFLVWRLAAHQLIAVRAVKIINSYKTFFAATTTVGGNTAVSITGTSYDFSKQTYYNDISVF